MPKPYRAGLGNYHPTGKRVGAVEGALSNLLGAANLSSVYPALRLPNSTCRSGSPRTIELQCQTNR